MVLTTVLGATLCRHASSNWPGSCATTSRRRSTTIRLGDSDITLTISLPAEAPRRSPAGPPSRATSNYIETVNLNSSSRPCRRCDPSPPPQQGGSAMGDMMQMAWAWAMATRCGSMAGAFGANKLGPRPMPGQAMYHVDQNGPGRPVRRRPDQAGLSPPSGPRADARVDERHAAWTPAGKCGVGRLVQRPAPDCRAAPPPVPPRPPAAPAAPDE